MNLTEIEDGLTALGIVSGYAIGGEPAKIILWNNDVEQPTNEQIAEAAIVGAVIRERKLLEEKRRQAYVLTADPLFFGFQRGDNTEQEWLDAVQSVKDAYPYPETTTA